MTELFLRVLNMSLAAGWAVLAVLLLRPMLRRCPRWICVLLWGVVAVRLLCPFAPESAVSLIPSAEPVPLTVETAVRPAIESGFAAVDRAVNPVLTAAFAPDPGDSANPLQIWIPLAAAAWIAGMAVMAGHAALSRWRLGRRVMTAVRCRDNVYRSEYVSSPFVLGLFRPRIYLPSAMEAGTAGYVLAHERAHIGRGDPWWKALGYLLLTVHWFNPLLWAAYRLLCGDIELACDERVIRGLESGQRADYSEALLACSMGRRTVAACPLAFGEVGVKERVRSVLRYRRPALWSMAAALAACALLAACFLTDPIPAGDHLTVTDSSSPAGANRLEYAMHLGEDVGSGVLQVEQWVDGTCVMAAPVPFTRYAETAEILMTPRREDGVQVGTDVQITTNQYGGNLLTYFPHPASRNTVGWSFTGYGTGEEIPAVPGEEKILAAMAFDTGSGVRVFDCETLVSEPERLREADHMIVVRAVFADNPLEDAGIAEAVPPVREVLTLSDVIALSEKGYALSWEDFEPYDCIETGSGLYIRVYEVQGLFSLGIGGAGPQSVPMYMRLGCSMRPDAFIDIRDGGVAEFIDACVAETAFDLQLAGNTSLQNSVTLTQDRPYWRLTVHNDGAEAIAVEMGGAVWDIAPGERRVFRADRAWRPGTYGVSLSAAGGQQGMEGRVLCETAPCMLP